MSDPAMAVAAWLLAAASLAGCARLAQRRTGDSCDWLAMACVFLAIDYLLPATWEILDLPFGDHEHPAQHPGLTSHPVNAMLLAASTVFLAAGYLAVAGRYRAPIRELRPSAAWMWIGALGTLLACWLWANSLGGFAQAFTNIHEVRAGRKLPESNLGWLLNLSKASWVFLAVGLSALITAQRWDRQIAAPLLLTASSVIMMLLRGGRGAFANAILVAMVMIARSKGSHSGRRIAAIALLIGVSAAIAIGLKPLSSYLAFRGQELTHADARSEALTLTQARFSSAGALGVIGGVVAQFAHFPIVAALAVEHSESAGFEPDRGQDLAIAVEKLLPATLFEPTDRPLSVQSTLLISGVDTSNVPPGFLGWCILSFGLPALPVTALAAGALLGASRLIGIALRQAFAIGDLVPLTLGLTFASGIAAGTPGDTLREATILVVAIGTVSLATTIVSTRKRTLTAAGMHPKPQR